MSRGRVLLIEHVGSFGLQVFVLPCTLAGTELVLIGYKTNFSCLNGGTSSQLPEYAPALICIFTV